MECQVTRVSTLEEELANLRQLPQPVGIMLFGADCKSKHNAINLILNTEWLGLQNVDDIDDEWFLDYEYAQCYQRTKNHLLSRFESGAQFNLIILDPESSADHEIRHGFVKAIQDAEAKAVVGIYIKAQPTDWLEDQLPFMTCNKDRQHKTFEHALSLLEQNPPTADGLNLLITI